MGRPQILSAEDENLLVAHIAQLRQDGVAIDREGVMGLVKEMLVACGIPAAELPVVCFLSLLVFLVSFLS